MELYSPKKIRRIRQIRGALIFFFLKLGRTKKRIGVRYSLATRSLRVRLSRSGGFKSSRSPSLLAYEEEQFTTFVTIKKEGLGIISLKKIRRIRQIRGALIFFSLKIGKTK